MGKHVSWLWTESLPISRILGATVNRSTRPSANVCSQIYVDRFLALLVDHEAYQERCTPLGKKNNPKPCPWAVGPGGPPFLPSLKGSTLTRHVVIEFLQILIDIIPDYAILPVNIIQ